MDGRVAGVSGPVAVLVLGVIALAVGTVTRVLAGGPLGYAALIGTCLVGGLWLAFAPCRGHPVPSPVPPADDALATAARRVLAGLDGVEHRWIEVGPEGPTVVVGPTGVVVVTPAVAAGQRTSPGRVDPSRWAHLHQVVAQVRSATVGGQRPVSVRGLAVTAPGLAPCPAAVADGELAVVPVDRLVDVVGQGTLLPRTAVATAFERIAQQLAPDAVLSHR